MAHCCTWGAILSANKDLWDRVKVTNPKAVKAITGKPYKGNSPKPYWLIERATEEFGPVGVGWGVIVKSERFERLSETDVLHVAVVSVWYLLDGKRTESFDQMGGTKAAYKSNEGKLIVDEDAGKKSVTDGMVKCLSMIGFAGDIFSGMWDDSKYVQWAGEEWKEREAANREPQCMAPGVLADWIAHIDSAANGAEFKERVADAEAACSEIGDMAALGKVQAAAATKFARAKAKITA